jgi:hypothetical protein
LVTWPAYPRSVSRELVTLLGRFDEEKLAWDLFWAAHRLITEGRLDLGELPGRPRLG